MRKYVYIALIAVLGFLLIYVGCQSAQRPTDGTLSAQKAGGKAGTTLIVSKDAEGYCRTIRPYDWSLIKEVVPTEDILIDQTESADIIYTLTATRTQLPDQTQYGVKGTIYVTNGGSRPTENLEIVDKVYEKTGKGSDPNKGWTLRGSQTIPVTEQIPAHTTVEYEYDVILSGPPSSNTYRNEANVTISNHSGKGIKTTSYRVSPISFPTTCELVEIDKTAELKDEEDDLSIHGFDVHIDIVNPPFDNPAEETWENLDSPINVFTINKTVTNLSAAPDTCWTFNDIATLTSSDTPIVRTAVGTVEICTPPEGPPPPPPPSGQGGTIGFWKRHLTQATLDLYAPISLGSQNVTLLADAIEYLNFYGSNDVKDASNGINKLYAKLLAAKLNVLVGNVPPAPVQTAIDEANTFLLTHDSTSWASLSTAQKNQVLAWMTTLTEWNNTLD